MVILELYIKVASSKAISSVMSYIFILHANFFFGQLYPQIKGFEIGC